MLQHFFIAFLLVGPLCTAALAQDASEKTAEEEPAEVPDETPATENATPAAEVPAEGEESTPAAPKTTVPTNESDTDKPTSDASETPAPPSAAPSPGALKNPESEAPVETPSGTADSDTVLPAPLSRVELKRIPPRFSYDIGLQFGYGEITYWREEVPPWATMGFNFAWGKHFGHHRIGPGIAFIAEGPVPVHMSLFLEPTFRWDTVKGWLQVGASLGPSFMLHHAQRTVVHQTSKGVGPVAALRVGWSEPYSRIGRRLHVVLEPKMRLIDGRMNPSVSIVIGSGRGY